MYPEKKATIPCQAMQIFDGLATLLAKQKMLD